MKRNVYFVSGTGTGIGKSYATGYIAKMWNERGIKTITMKLVQTGNLEISEDIELHRRIMGCPLQPEDLQKLTMPEIFSYPCSPHLASRIDGRRIDFEKIKRCTEILSKRFDRVLIEGAGGLMVPLTETLLTIDYVRRERYPLILAASSVLGSINHILLSLEAVSARGINLYAFAYNLHEDKGCEDETIKKDTRNYVSGYLEKHFPDTLFVDIPELELR